MLIPALLVTALLQVSASLPPLAPTAASTAASTSAAKRRCTMIVPVGSHLAKRVCLTDPDWRRFNRDNEEQFHRTFSRRGAGMCATPPNCD